MKPSLPTRIKMPRRPSAGVPAGTPTGSTSSAVPAARTGRTLPPGMALPRRTSGLAGPSTAPAGPALVLDGPRLGALIDSLLDKEIPISGDRTGPSRMSQDQARERMAEDIRGSVQQFLVHLPGIFAEKKTKGSPGERLQHKAPSSDTQNALEVDLKSLDRELTAAALEDEVAKRAGTLEGALGHLLELRAAQLALRSPDQQKGPEKSRAADALGTDTGVPIAGGTVSSAGEARESRRLKQANERDTDRPEHTQGFDGLARVMADPDFPRAVRRQVASAFLGHLRDGLISAGDHNRILMALYPPDQDLGRLQPNDRRVPFLLTDTPQTQDRLIRFISTSYPKSLESLELRALSEALDVCLAAFHGGDSNALGFLLGRGFESAPPSERNRVRALVSKGMTPEAAQKMVGWIPFQNGEEYPGFCASPQVWGRLGERDQYDALDKLVEQYVASDDLEHRASIRRFILSLPADTESQHADRLECVNRMLHAHVSPQGDMETPCKPWKDKTAEDKRFQMQSLMACIERVPLSLAGELLKHTAADALDTLPICYGAADADKRSKFIDLVANAPPSIAARDLYAITRDEVHHVPMGSLQDRPAPGGSVESVHLPGVEPLLTQLLGPYHERPLRDEAGESLTDEQALAILNLPPALDDADGLQFFRHLMSHVSRVRPPGQALTLPDLPAGVTRDDLRHVFIDVLQFDSGDGRRDFERVAWPRLPLPRKRLHGLQLMQDYPFATDLGKKSIRTFFGALLRSEERFEKKLGMEGLVHLVKEDMGGATGAVASGAALERSISILRSNGWAGMDAASLSHGVAELVAHIASIEDPPSLPSSLWGLLVEAGPHLTLEGLAKALAACLAHGGPQLGGIVPDLLAALPDWPPAHRRLAVAIADIAAQASPEWRRALDMVCSEAGPGAPVPKEDLSGGLRALPHMPPAFLKGAAKAIQPWLEDFSSLNADQRKALMLVGQHDTEDPFYAKVLAAHAEAIDRALPDGTRIDLRMPTSFPTASGRALTLLDELYQRINFGPSDKAVPALRVLARRYGDAAVFSDKLRLRAVLFDAMQVLPPGEVLLLCEELCLADPVSAAGLFTDLLALDEEQAPRGRDLGRFIATLSLRSPTEGAALLENPEVLARLSTPPGDGQEAAGTALRALCLADPVLGGQAIRDIGQREPGLATSSLDPMMANARDGVPVEPAEVRRRTREALSLRRQELDGLAERPPASAP